jgi:hypothetical protein
MTQKNYLLLFIFAIFAIGCTSNRQTSGDVPFIDVRRNHPVKEIVLTDIADVTFVHFCTNDDDFLFRGGINFATENRFVVADWASNSVLFFSRDGKPISRFNRWGQGPEEYVQPDFVNLIFDEAADEVFIPVLGTNHTQVYSSTGEFKRQLTLPHSNNLGFIAASFNDKSLLIFNSEKKINRILRKIAGDDLAFSPGLDSAFVLISKIDGSLLGYVEMPRPTIDLSVRTGTGTGSPMWMRYERIVKHSDGLLLSNPENDTIYLFCRDRTLTPVLRKIPLLSDGNRRVLENIIDTGKYQFMRVADRITDRPREQDYRREFLVRNKETGEVFRQRLILSDFQGKEFFIHASGAARSLENEYFFELDLIELKQAYRENRLSGELKELVATLNEDEDNNVFMLLRFR